MFIPLQQFVRMVRRPVHGDASTLTPLLAVPTSPRSGTSRLASDDSGVAAIEFAFIAPIMIAMLMGIIDISNAVSINWRMVQLNRTLSDLTSQSKILQNVDVDKIFAASTATLAPYNGTLPHMVIASVVVNPSGIPRVCWIESRNGSAPLAVGNTVALPNPAMKVPGTSYIISQVKIGYTGYVSPDFDMMANWLYYKPRAGYVGGTSGAEQVVRNAEANAC
ncbi:MAG: TadE/TadG family type IV pilus assembly protein [Bosea sp. (in: a-proteobacteria)]